MLALAIYNQIILPIHFSLLLYKKLISQYITLDDLAELDVKIVKGLEFLLDMRKGRDDVADLMLTFSVGIDHWSTPREIALIDGGASTSVRNQNVVKYFRAYVDRFANQNNLTPFQMGSTSFS
jgi:hypothetical protein